MAASVVSRRSCRADRSVIDVVNFLAIHGWEGLHDNLNPKVSLFALAAKRKQSAGALFVSKTVLSCSRRGGGSSLSLHVALHSSVGVDPVPVLICWLPRFELGRAEPRSRSWFRHRLVRAHGCMALIASGL